MPRKVLAQELIPVLKRALADAVAVKGELQGMQLVVQDRIIGDLITALDLCHARVTAPAGTEGRSKPSGAEPAAVAAPPDLATAAGAVKRPRRKSGAAA